MLFKNGSNGRYSPPDGNKNICYSQIESRTTKFSDKSWTCSNHYNNSIYSYFTCPYEINKCGQFDDKNDNTPGEWSFDVLQ